MKFVVIALGLLLILDTDQTPKTKELIGVYQGKSLFIQNPYLPELREFCIEKIYVNSKEQKINYRVSAIKLDFKNKDLYTPVVVRIVSRDSLCSPIILNPDAILFHTSFKFLTINLSDSALTWSTEGEREAGSYAVEKLQYSTWQEVERIPSSGKFENAEYSFIPQLEDGPNKYRVKYEFGNGRYLYSPEEDYDHYPEPVELLSLAVRNELKFSRTSRFEIYDMEGKEVISGEGSNVDVSYLYPGDYVIYFDGTDPRKFSKLEN